MNYKRTQRTTHFGTLAHLKALSDSLLRVDSALQLI